MNHNQYLEPNQARERSDRNRFEDLLGDTIEGAYGQGIHDLDGIVAALNQQGPPCPSNGGEWTPDNFTALMAELGR